MIMIMHDQLLQDITRKAAIIIDLADDIAHNDRIINPEDALSELNNRLLKIILDFTIPRS